MRKFKRTSANCALAVTVLAGAATAQTPAPATSVAVAAPTYISIPLEIAINRPAADVWKRVASSVTSANGCRFRAPSSGKTESSAPSVPLRAVW